MNIMKTNFFTGTACALAASVVVCAAADAGFDGLNLDLGNLSRTSAAQSRSISPENFTGEKGKAGMATQAQAQAAARELGPAAGRFRPSVVIKGTSHVHPGGDQRPWRDPQIWMTPVRWQYALEHPAFLLGR